MKAYRLLIIFTIILLTPVCSFAASVLKGRVTDSDGKPVQGAIVEIKDLKTGAATDTGGYYIIRNLPKGKYALEVHLLGYSTITGTATIEGEVEQNFTLSESVVEKNTVVVTGTSLATEERRNITPVQSISLREMHERAATNVIDAITELPGVMALTTGSAIAKPIIRGLGYNRVITLNDGVRQEGQQWGDEHGIEIDDYNVTRVEVLKGPASLAYGSDALAGVVNIISDPAVSEGHITGHVSLNYQTNASLSASHADIGGKHNGFLWQAYGTHKAAQDYRNSYDGRVFNSRFQNFNYGGTVGLNKSWGSSQLTYRSFHMKTGLPEGERDSATGTQVREVAVNGIAESALVTDADFNTYSMVVPYQRIDHEKIVWDNNIYLGNGGRVGLTLAYQSNLRREYDDVVEPEHAGLSLLLQTATYNFRYFLPAVDGWQLTTGINGMAQWNRNKGDEFLVPDYSLADGGVFIMGRKEWNKWAVAGGARYDMRMLTSYEKTGEVETSGGPVATMLAAPFTVRYNNLNGSLGASYNASERAIIKFNVATGYRAPNIAELSANGVHEGTIRYEIGNNGLAPEKSIQADLGVSWNAEHLMVNVSVFNNYIRDFIYIRRLPGAGGNDSIPQLNNEDQFAAFMFTQGNANLYGGEVYLDFHPHPLDWLHLENTFSYVRGKLMEPVDGTDNLPYMPPARWLVELRAQRRNLGSRLRNAYAKVGAEINMAQNDVFTAYQTERPAAGYTLFNAGIGADITNRKRGTICSITLAAQNLTDVAYQHALNRLRYASMNNVTGRQGLFNMGRNISLLVSVPLDFK